MKRESSDDKSKSAISSGDDMVHVLHCVDAEKFLCTQGFSEAQAKLSRCFPHFPINPRQNLWKLLVELGHFDSGLTECQALRQSEPRPLPDDPDILRSLLQAAHDVRDPYRRLISSVRERSQRLAAHRADREEKLQREFLRLSGEQVRADLAKCRACSFRPLLDYLGWSTEKVVVLCVILGAFAPAEDDLSAGDCYEDCQWASQLEQAFLKPVEDLHRAILERLAQPAVTASSTDPSACVLVVTVDGDSSKVVFGTPHLRRKPIPVDYEVAIFLNEVYQGQGKPVACETINEKHKLDLRPNRIRKKIPKELRPCFVTKTGSGTHFDKDALAEICQKLCFD